MLNEADIVLDEYEQSVEDALDTLAPVSPETRRRLDAILAHEQERQGGILDAGGVNGTRPQASWEKARA
ncbi:MAG: hypothetical protein LBR23_05485 [Spirochaetaceae bacterium]|nr:hypothetical protein [Spirochaetaceae bacterium]